MHQYKFIKVNLNKLLTSRRKYVCLSSVCNVRAPYSGDWNFRQCFYAVWDLGYPLTFE